jgi:hypothetical protein
VKGHFEAVEALLTTLYDAVGESIPGQDTGWSKEFFDVGEYGLALDSVVDAYFEEGIVASPEVKHLVGRLASLIGMDVDEVLSKLAGMDAPPSARAETP